MEKRHARQGCQLTSPSGDAQPLVALSFLCPHQQHGTRLPYLTALACHFSRAFSASQPFVSFPVLCPHQHGARLRRCCLLFLTCGFWCVHCRASHPGFVSSHLNTAVARGLSLRGPRPYHILSSHLTFSHMAPPPFTACSIPGLPTASLRTVCIATRLDFLHTSATPHHACRAPRPAAGAMQRRKLRWRVVWAGRRPGGGYRRVQRAGKPKRELSSLKTAQASGRPACSERRYASGHSGARR